MDQQIIKIKLLSNNREDLFLSIARILSLKKTELLSWESNTSNIFITINSNFAGNGESIVKALNLLPGVHQAEILTDSEETITNAKIYEEEKNTSPPTIEHNSISPEKPRQVDKFLDALNQPLLLVNTYLCIEACNEAARKWLNLPLNPIGMAIEKILPDDISTPIIKNIETEVPLQEIINSSDASAGKGLNITPIKHTHKRKLQLITFLNSSLHHRITPLLDQEENPSNQTTSPPRDLNFGDNLIQGEEDKPVVSNAHHDNSLLTNICEHCGTSIKFGAVYCNNCFSI